MTQGITNRPKLLSGGFGGQISSVTVRIMHVPRPPQPYAASQNSPCLRLWPPAVPEGC
jgi:hypothetical protein